MSTYFPLKCKKCRKDGLVNQKKNVEKCHQNILDNTDKRLSWISCLLNEQTKSCKSVYMTYSHCVHDI